MQPICDAVFEICSARSNWFWDIQRTLTTIVWFLRYVSHVNYHVNIRNQTRHEIGLGDMQCTLMGEVYDPSPGSSWFWDMCCTLLDDEIGLWYIWPTCGALYKIFSARSRQRNWLPSSTVHTRPYMYCTVWCYQTCYYFRTTWCYFVVWSELGNACKEYFCESCTRLYYLKQ